MLKDSFYNILSLVRAEDMNDLPGLETQVFTANIRLNGQHPVYQGHFPGKPVVPGVCQIQMIKEIFSEAIHREVSLVNADNIKFLAIIVPEMYPNLDIKITAKRQKEEAWEVSGTISKEEVQFLKFKGTFV
jgi:3-hydroxyacyl-[acyl-carrier-protein] dehydratase